MKAFFLRLGFVLIKITGLAYGIILFSGTSCGQTVGLVLSGGGAKGMAHIGVIRALEENDIPIDYISGTSIGAMVGSLYASGYTTEEMEMIFTSQRFKQWQSGEVESQYYYSYMQNTSAEMLSIKFKADSSETKAYLPSSIVAPHQMDYAFMQMLSAPAAAANYDFDSLYIPFRCMATDIYERKSVAFREGYLPSAVRASMTFPLYFKPIEIKGKLLFDGGIYDNFPKKVMIDDFNPDIIIGVKVASNYGKPDKDDIISQIESLVAGHTDYSLDKENGILIDIKLNNVKLMDFESASETQEKGYLAAMEIMDSIKTKISRRISPYKRNKARLEFRKKYPELVFNEIIVEGLKANQEQYIKNLISVNDDIFDMEELKEQYNKIIASEHIENMYPIAVKNKNDKYFTLRLPVEKSKKFKAGIGGNFSLTDMNQAYIGGSYRFFGSKAYKVGANLYFGSFYNSAHFASRVYFPVKSELFADVKANYSRKNFQNGKANTFYEDKKPPYIVQNQIYVGGMLGLPLTNNGYAFGGYNYSNDLHYYYQIPAFRSDDVADKSYMNNNIMYAGYDLNSLNHKNFANEGKRLFIRAFYILGKEIHTPGTTSLTDEMQELTYNYFAFKLKYTYYSKLHRHFTLGTNFELVLSDKPFLCNYTSAISDAPAYNPFPYAQTLFHEKYRAHNYIAAGLSGIFHLTDYLSIRTEVQLFQPYQKISQDISDNRIIAVYEEPYTNRYFSGRSALVYHSMIGPIYLSWYYFQNFSHDFYFSAGLGFYIFNETAKQLE